jgi:hypothetical protein
MELLTGCPEVNQQLRDSVQRNIGHPRARAKAISFYQHPKNLGSVGNR